MASKIKVAEHAKISEIDFAHKAKEILLKGVMDEADSKREDNELKGQKLVDTLINQYNMQMEAFINPKKDAKSAA